MREFKYVATFSDGAVVERRSTRNYLFAWRTAIVSGLSGNTAEVVPAVCPEPHSLAEHLNRSMGFGK